MFRWKTFAIGWSLALALLLFAQHKSTMSEQISYHEVVDLTHDLNDHSPNWEGTQQSPFSAKQLGTIEKDGYYSRVFTTQEHYGTHLDAPAHFAKGMWTVDQIPSERLVRPMAVLNVRAKTASQPDYEISVQDIAEYESKHGEIPSGAVVMAYTGWEDRWNNAKTYRNANAEGVPHFPGYSLEAATGPPVHGERERVSVGKRRQPGTATSRRCDDRGCADQTGERLWRTGTAAGTGEVGKPALSQMQFVHEIARGLAHGGDATSPQRLGNRARARRCVHLKAFGLKHALGAIHVICVADQKDTLQVIGLQNRRDSTG